MLAEPSKPLISGVTFVPALARSKTPIAVSKEGRASSRLFSRRDLVSIVQVQGGKVAAGGCGAAPRSSLERGLGFSAFSITTTLRLAMESAPPYPHVGELNGRDQVSSSM